MNWLFREPPRDPRLAEALRRLEADSPAGDPTLLQRRILAAARPGLSGLRSSNPRWWEWISRWMPVAVPVGLAAALAAGFLVPGTNKVVGSGYAADVGSDSTLVIAAFSEGSSGSQLDAYLMAPESGDWLFEQAVSQ